MAARAARIGGVVEPAVRVRQKTLGAILRKEAEVKLKLRSLVRAANNEARELETFIVERGAAERVPRALAAAGIYYKELTVERLSNCNVAQAAAYFARFQQMRKEFAQKETRVGGDRPAENPFGEEDQDQDPQVPQGEAPPAYVMQV